MSAIETIEEISLERAQSSQRRMIVRRVLTEVLNRQSLGVQRRVVESGDGTIVARHVHLPARRDAIVVVQSNDSIPSSSTPQNVRSILLRCMHAPFG